jgi:acetyl-CoA acetyltransferase
MARHALCGSTAVAGLGLTEMGRVYGRDAMDFAIEAVMLALDDAGLEKRELDGLLINAGIGRGVDLPLAQALGLRELDLLTQMNAYGSSAAQMVQYAAMAVHHGLARYVACVFADDPLREGEATGAAYAGARRPRTAGMSSLYPLYGFAGAIPFYASAAQRHMDLYGTTQDQLGQIAISTRAWAVRNPRAAKREPLTLEQYHASPWVVEPFHVLDCCLVSNGGVAVIVTTAERARDLAKPPVYIRGMAQAHRLDVGRSGLDTLVEGPGARSGPRAFAMAGAAVDDVTLCQLYDCYTYTVLATLEDYGFCKKGEGGSFVADGKLGPGGALPTNTGGGELSAYYMWGMTPISEAVLQARGQQGERQVASNDLVLVTGNGGVFNHHGTLLLSPHRS